MLPPILCVNFEYRSSCQRRYGHGPLSVRHVAAAQESDFLMFGAKGLIAENVRDEQRKIVNYYHLVTNLVILHTLVTMSDAIRKMVEDGHSIDQEAPACLSPYQTDHINRFGEYELRTGQVATTMEPALSISFLNDVRTPAGF